MAAARALTVKGRAPKTGYTRKEFGQRWADTDRGGCDQRNDVLRRDLHDFTTKPGTRGCVVLTGTLDDPFTGTVINFIRGEMTSTAVQIDHIVPLFDAWQKGAQQWTLEKRTQFANEFLNLLAVDGPANAAKRDGDTATWLPPNEPYRCAYVARQVAVKQTYELWVTHAEQDAMVRILSKCPDEQLPTQDSVAAPEPDPATEAEAPRTTPPATPEPSPTSRTDEDGGDGVTYANCAEVQAAGKAPIRKGDPGYCRHLDGDGDGIGCE